ncbi:MAG: hypothetical protein ACPGLY_01100 [Rubripirellula sp.]
MKRTPLIPALRLSLTLRLVLALTLVLPRKMPNHCGRESNGYTVVMVMGRN